MNRFHLGQFHVGDLLAHLTLRLTSAAEARPETGKNRRCSADSYKNCDTATMDGPASNAAAADPLAILEASKRRWPSRYY